MSDDERKGDDEIDLKHLQEEIEMVKGWGVRHNGMIEEMKDDIRHFYQKFRDLETGNTGRRTGRSRRGNPQYRPAVGGRRTRGKLRAKSRAKSRKKRRRKRGGTRKNAGPEKPIVDYYYRINIYHGGQGEKVLQYGNVIGKYIGLAEVFHDGYDSIEGKKYMFKARVPDDDGDEIEAIGEIISIIGPSITYINGGRRKKRTKKRRKSKGRKRRKSRRKKRRRKKR